MFYFCYNLTFSFSSTSCLFRYSSLTYHWFFRFYLLPSLFCLNCVFGTLEFWVIQPWKHGLWKVRGPKPLCLSSLILTVTLSHGVWKFTGAGFQGNRSWFKVQFLLHNILWVKDFKKTVIHIFVHNVSYIHEFNLWIKKNRLELSCLRIILFFFQNSSTCQPSYSFIKSWRLYEECLKHQVCDRK